MTTTLTGAGPRTHLAVRRAGFGSALGFELMKLRKQVRTRALLVGVLLAPIPVALAIHSQGNPPKDTLFGRYATTNGFSLALLVLGYAAQWVLPLLTAVVAGDIFASEDHHGTWKTVLTRSVGRGPLFAAKTVAAIVFAVVVVVLLSASTILVSVLVGGHGTLIGLTGQPIGAGAAWRLVSLSWLSTIAPTVAFTGLAVLLSVWSRNVAVGVATPVVLGMVLQLVGSLGVAESLRPYLPTTAFEAWHGFLAGPAFVGPFVTGLVTSAVWTALTLGAAWAVLRRRDIVGG